MAQSYAAAAGGGDRAPQRGAAYSPRRSVRGPITAAPRSRPPAKQAPAPSAGPASPLQRLKQLKSDVKAVLGSAAPSAAAVPAPPPPGLRLRQTKTAPQGSRKKTLTTMKRDILQDVLPPGSAVPRSATSHPLRTGPSAQRLPDTPLPPLPGPPAAVAALQEAVQDILAQARFLHMRGQHAAQLAAAAAAGTAIATPLPKTARKAGRRRGRGAALTPKGQHQWLALGIRQATRAVTSGAALLVLAPRVVFGVPSVADGVARLREHCEQRGVLFLQPLSKRALGKALDIHARVTAVALLSADALHERLADLRSAWAAATTPPPEPPAGEAPSADGPRRVFNVHAPAFEPAWMPGPG